MAVTVKSAAITILRSGARYGRSIRNNAFGDRQVRANQFGSRNRRLNPEMLAAVKAPQVIRTTVENKRISGLQDIYRFQF
jgi:hypothetical protein